VRHYVTLALVRLPGASEYHDGQVNVLSCLPDWASCLATKSWASLCLCFHWQIAFIICTVGGGGGGGGGRLRTLENPGEGYKKRPWKSRGRGEKESRNPGCGLIRDQNPGDSLRLKPFSRGRCSPRKRGRPKCQPINLPGLEIFADNLFWC
jgi:hypothetical protein